MITNLIVLLSLVLASVYAIIWLFRYDFRTQVERPKYHFQNQLSEYDKQYFNQEVTQATETEIATTAVKKEISRRD